MDTGRTVTSSPLVELTDLTVPVCLADFDLDNPEDDLLDKLLVIEYPSDSPIKEKIKYQQLLIYQYLNLSPD